MNYNRLKIYYKTMLLRRGISLVALITSRCNFNCPYCAMHIACGGKVPQCPESTFEEWKQLIDRFPVKIREVSVSGGEPTLHKDFEKIVEYLLKFTHVKVYSNLTHPERLMNLKKNHRLSVHATFHHSDDPGRFDEAYKLIYSKHRIEVSEIGGMKKLSYSKTKHLIKNKSDYGSNFNIGPDLRISAGCWDGFLNMLKS